MNENLEFEAQTTATEPNPQVEPLKARVFMFLEDENWESANTYCEKILDIDPTNASAFLGKLMAENKIGKKEDIIKLQSPLDDNALYQKILRFGDETIKNEISEYNEHIKQVYQQRKSAKKRMLTIVGIALSSIILISILIFVIVAVIIPTIKYNKAESHFENGDYEEAIEIFTSLDDFKNSSAKISLCKYELANEYIYDGEFESAHELLSELDDYKDSKTLLREVSWEIMYKFLKNEGEFSLPIGTSTMTATVDDGKILVGYRITFDQELKTDVKCVACFNKDGSVSTLGISDSTYGNSTEYVEAYGKWDIGTYKADDEITWDDIDPRRTGLFQYNDESMLESQSKFAFESMAVFIETVLKKTETDVTIQDFGFYAYE